MKKQAEEFEAALARASAERDAAKQAQAEAEAKQAQAVSPLEQWSADQVKLRRFAVELPGTLITRVQVPYVHEEIPTHFRCTAFTAVVEQGCNGPARFTTADGEGGEL